MLFATFFKTSRSGHNSVTPLQRAFDFFLPAICGVITGVLVVYGMTLTKIYRPQVGTSPAKQADLVSKHQSDETPPFGSSKSPKYISVRQLQEKFEGTNEAQLNSFLSTQNAEFWRSDPQAGFSIQFAFKGMRRTKSLPDAVCLAENFVDSLNLSPALAARMLTRCFRGSLDGADNQEIVPALRALRRDNGLKLLEAFLMSLTFESPQELYDKARALSVEAQLASPESFEAALSGLLARVAAVRFRHLPVQQLALLSWGPGFQQSIIRQLALFNRGTSFSLLAELARVSPAEAAKVSLDILVAPDEAAQLCELLEPAFREQFRSAYVESVLRLSPGYVPMIPSLCPVELLPNSLRTRISTWLLEFSPGSLSSWSKSLTPQERSTLISTAYEAIMFRGRDPENKTAIAEFFLREVKLPTRETRALFSAAIKALAANNLETALSYVKEQSSDFADSLRRDAYQARCVALAADLPQDIPAFCEAAPSNIRDFVVKTAAEQWALRDFEGSLKWLATNKDTALREKAEAAILSNPSLHIPIDQFERVVLDRIHTSSDPRVFSKAASYLLTNQATADLDAALATVDRLPEGIVKESAVASLVGHWSKLDPVSASEWIVTLPDSNTRDHAVAELASAARDDPEFALANIAAIVDQQLRQKSARTVIGAWKGVNPELLIQLIAKSPLPSSERKELESMVLDSESRLK